MTPAEWGLAQRRMSSLFPRATSLDELAASEWLVSLEDLELRDVMVGIRRWSEASSFAPSLAELRDAAGLATMERAVRERAEVISARGLGEARVPPARFKAGMSVIHDIIAKRLVIDRDAPDFDAQIYAEIDRREAEALSAKEAACGRL